MASVVRPGRFAAWLVVAAGLLLCLSASDARAQQPAARAVVFVTPAVTDLDAALRDALTAQMSDVAAELEFDRFQAEGESLRHQVNAARAIASSHAAIGVFWVDAQSTTDWLLYLAEPAGERVLVRKILVESDGLAAATEAVAVITRQSTEALLSGETIGMRPLFVPPEPSPFTPPSVPPATPPRAPPRAPPSPATRGDLAIALGYRGDSPAPQIPWQSGARIGAVYLTSGGLYVGLGFVLYKEVNVRAPHLAFSVSRNPVDAELGFAFGKGALMPSLALSGKVELLSRKGLSAEPPVSPTSDSTRAVVFLSPRVRLDYSLTRVFGLFLLGGVDFAANRFSYVTRVDGVDRPLLEPRALRPAVEAGAVFWP